MAQEPSVATATKLCVVCSKLNIQGLTRPLFPCRNPWPKCSNPQIEGYEVAEFVLGSVDEIKSRRLSCDVCKLVAESLDKEPSDFDGKCRFKEFEAFCSFRLPKDVEAQDPTVTHFHLTQSSMIFEITATKESYGPFFPWEVKEKERVGAHYIFCLQAKATSCIHSRDLSLVSLQTEHDFLETIGGRYVDTQVNAELIRSWLHDCESKHGKQCQHLSRLPTGKDKVPTFVVDVTKWCIVDTPSRCRYVVLSYVWGKDPVFRHLQEATQALRKPNSLRLFPIPTTIRNAITLVHAIGERYIWVDSICVIQDNLKMQQPEIMRMGSIYSNALFTIVAAAGGNANSGLPGVEPGSREQAQKVLKLGNHEFLTVIDIWKTRGGIDDTVWAERGWTFQERVLSNRLLVFSENQVYWSCSVATHSEERALENIAEISRFRLGFPEEINSEFSGEFLEPYEYRCLYDRLLTGYRERRLSYQSDILNAFNGVAEMLAAIQNDTFFWGLPESQFSHGIVWDVFDQCSRNNIEVPILKSDGSTEMVPIPSWGWGAWLAQDWTHNPNFMDGYGNIVEPIIQFYLVDNERKIVKIEEQLSQDGADDRTRAPWRGEEPRALNDVVQLLKSPSPLQIGRLYFWTSHAKVKAFRRWGMGHRVADYVLLPTPDSVKANSNYSEVIDQDFIVIAGRASGSRLGLLAIEWIDGIAYRVGRTEVAEKEWLEVNNRQWRLITLG